MKQISDFKSIIEFLISNGSTLEDAIEASRAPLSMHQGLRDIFGETIEVTEASMLFDKSHNSDILIKCKGEDNTQPYIDFYKRSLAEKEWNKNTIDSILNISARILERMPDPEYGHHFTSKGLVVGHVQSGKTANMGAVISRAADHGYKMIIVLAGLLNDLRFQTQCRFDQDITGQTDDGTVVNHKHIEGTKLWAKFTEGTIGGDFKKQSISFDLGLERPKIVVMKKHPTVMNHFIDFFGSAKGINLEDFPALIIDDEADHATINTKYGKLDDEGKEVNPSTTNKVIRDLVSLFPKCSYVGYTATPFANLSVDANIEEDLYPRDFICILDEPSNYFGPRQLFGLGMRRSAASPEYEEEPELDIARIISDDDYQELDVANFSSDVPRTLKSAIDSFILSSCARLTRGDKGHCSMLVHPSRLKDDHSIFECLTKKYLDHLKQVSKYTSKPSYTKTKKRFEDLYDSDFKETTLEVESEDCPLHDFEDVWRFFPTIIQNVEVVVANSTSKTGLVYPPGTQKFYIVVGGNKLSRGVTLEGLSVSLFFRNTPKSYDTALQMGRWFGYRKGYQDLTRIFVDLDTFDSFRDLSRIMLELKENLKKYSHGPRPCSPTEVFPKIRAHANMIHTARNKQGASNLHTTYERDVAQTITFPKNTKILKSNLLLGQAWVGGLGKALDSIKHEGTKYFKNVDVNEILKFIESYAFSENATKVSKRKLISYIKKQNEHEELVSWDVIVPKGSKKCSAFRWSDSITTNMINRSAPAKKKKDNLAIKVLYEPADVSVWRDECNREEDNSKVGGLFLYVVDKNSAAGKKNALFKCGEDATSILGIAIAFPDSESDVTTVYYTQG